MHFKMSGLFQKWIKIVLIYVLCIGTSQAATSSILSQLIQDASQNNPQIRAARERSHAAQYAISPSRSLPDPKVGFGYIKMNGNNDMDVDPRREQMIGVSQEIPFPSKLFMRGRVATSGASQVQATYNAIYHTVIAQVKKSYYDLYFIDKSIEILKRNQRILDKMEKSAKINYSVGKTPQQDIYRAQTEISRLQMRMVMLKQERLSMQADINRLLNRSLDDNVATQSQLSITTVHLTLGDLYQLVDKCSPQLQAQQKNVEKSNNMVKLKRLDYYPDVEIEAGKLRDTAMHTQGYQVMLNATIPLYFMSKQNYEVRESLANYNADVEDLYSTHKDLSFQIKNSYLLVQRSGQLIDLIKNTIIPQAKLTFNSSRENYGVGKVDFMTMLNNLLTLQDNELELQAEIVQHEKAVAQIEEITGVRV